MEFYYDRKDEKANNLVKKIQQDNPLQSRKKTILGNIIGTIKNYTRHLKNCEIVSQHIVIKMSDGGTICFHHYTNLSNKSTDIATTSNSTLPRNILVILDGFGGGPQHSNYPLICNFLQDPNWQVANFHRRGIHCPLTSAAQHQAGCDEDIVTMLNILHQRNPSSSLYILGISAGGIIGLRTLGKYPLNFVKGICTVSSAIHSGMHNDVNPYLANIMLRTPRRILNNFANDYYNDYKKFTCEQRKIYQELQSIGSRDEKFIDLAGNKSINGVDKSKEGYGKKYYNKWGESCNLIRKYLELECKLHTPSVNFDSQYLVENWIHNIKQPCLVINAKDDIICKNPEKFAHVLSRVNKGIYLITTYGGHCGYPSEDQESPDWAEHTAQIFFNHISNGLY